MKKDVNFGSRFGVFENSPIGVSGRAKGQRRKPQCFTGLIGV
jgi:hypothetical protein